MRVQPDQREKEEVRVPGDGRTGGEVPTVRELDGIHMTSATHLETLDQRGGRPRDLGAGRRAQHRGQLSLNPEGCTAIKK